MVGMIIKARFPRNKFPESSSGQAMWPLKRKYKHMESSLS